MKLIINADDFGLSESINDGIIEGIESGYITSTSLMINMPFAKDAIKKALEHNLTCVGLHINMTVGKPVIANDNLTQENGDFLYNKNQIDNKKLTYEDAYKEIMAQIEKVREYSKGKLKIDHLDSHHFLMLNENIKMAVEDIAQELNIPVRNENNIQAKCPNITYMEFTIENVCLGAIEKMISKYKNKDIIVELVTHSGFVDEFTKTVTSYLNRKEELDVLMESKNNGLFEDIELINYSQF